jgi:carotenoid cleavage dioxygenase
MRFEADVEDCIVSHGEIPSDLAGGFYRCGPTWKRPTKQGTNGILSMDGMVQSLIIRDGRADFRNRWVHTPKYVLEGEHNRGMFEWSDGAWGDWRTWGYGDVVRDRYTTGVPQGVTNINVFPFAGDVLATGEQGSPPVALDPMTLETKGLVPWSSKLARGINDPACFGDGGFSAHPKWDPETGELYGWSYTDQQPYVTVYLIAPHGGVRTLALDAAPYNSVAHDIWLTENWIVLPFQPFVISQERIRQNTSILGWEPDLPIVLAVIPRDLSGPVRWIDTGLEPQYVMHTMSANTVGNTLELDAPIFDRPPFPFEFDVNGADQAVPLFFSLAKSTLGRWTVDLESGMVKSERLSDRPSELPKIDERFFGRPYTRGFMVGGRPKRHGMSMNSLIARDMRTGVEEEFLIRGDRPAAVLEPAFVPRTTDAAEADGYLIVPVSHWADRLGEYLIFDTDDITVGPVCRIEIPFLMGWTPHGHWMDFR